MTNVRTPGKEQRSELFEVRKPRKMTEAIYFLVDPQYTFVKIGYTNNIVARIKQHRTSWHNFEIHAIIAGDKDNERQIHDEFIRYRESGNNETFRIEGKVTAYLDYLHDRAWATHKLDEIHHLYPYPNRFPWRAPLEITQGELFNAHPEIRKPKPRSERILRTILSESDEWHTPPIYIEAARRVMGSIDLDPASNPLAQQTVRATYVLTRDDDGLLHYWRGNIWLNPPYADLGKKFVRHLLSEYNSGRVKQAILCLNNHSTDSSWFQPLFQFPICFAHHRPNFRGGEKNGAMNDSGPTKGITFTYIGPYLESFFEEFSAFGNIVQTVKQAKLTREQFRRRYSDGWEV